MKNQVVVWDILIRLFHGLLVMAFLVAYLTEDDFLIIHSWAGYLIISLLIIRVIWGLIGSQYAHFSTFIYPAAVIFKYLSDEIRGQASRYLGHNPAGGAMVIALLLSLFLTTISGLLVYGFECSGPLSNLLCNELWLIDIAKEAHELFADSTVFLVSIHILGVIFASYVHQENLIASMWHGRKQPIIKLREETHE